jgi:alpha-beta hydrolase superfamily lysophospholipase
VAYSAGPILATKDFVLPISPHTCTGCTPRPRRAARIARLAAALAGLSLLTLAAPVVAETVATLPPPFPRSAANPQTALGLAYEEVAFPTGDGLTLRGWFIPAGVPGAPAVLYAPATGHDQRSGLSLVPSFHRAGYHVLLFSYRGHGRSDGHWGEFTYGQAESRDVDAAVRYLTIVRGIRRVGAIGHSAGAVAAILSAARTPRLGAIVALAPFTCVREVWNTSRPALVPPIVLNWTLWAAERLRGFRGDQVCPVEVVDRIAPRPLLLIHGTGDRRITVAQMHRLFASARAPKALWLVEGATHSSIRSPVFEQLAPDVIAFLDRTLRDGPGG